MIITDGKGRGFAAGVNRQGQVETFSEAVPGGVYAALEQQHWTVNTQDVVLTSDSTSAILFLRYSGSERLVIPRLFLTRSDSTGGSTNETVFGLWRNPTSMSGGSAVTAINRNFNGTDTLSGIKQVGAEGSAFTGGTRFAQQTPPDSASFSVAIEDEPFILESGNSFGISADPPTSNSSVTVRAAILCYEIVT